MGNTLNYKAAMDEQNFLVIRKFLNKEEMQKILKSVDKWHTHPLCTLSPTANNSSVTNSHRLQSILYSEEWLAKGKEKYEKIDKYFLSTTSILFPLLKPKIKTIFENMGFYNWEIVRMTIMYTFPGCPEQEVHHDNDVEDGIYFLSIPLQYTTVDMGSTIFYDERYVKHLRKEKPKQLDNEPFDKKKVFYNNIGYVKDFSKKDQESLEKGRRVFNLDIGDMTIHSSSTLHHGGANSSKRNRCFIFIMVKTTDTTIVDFYDIQNTQLFLVNSQKHENLNEQ